MDRVLVGVDGSDASIEALRWAGDLSARANLALIGARVFDSPQAELDPGRDRELHEQEVESLDAACRALEPAPPEVETVLLDGDPAGSLLDEARGRRADLLVVGGRGSGGFIHLHLGSVAHHLTHHTDIPLAVVPKEGAAPTTGFVVGCDGSPGSAAAIDLVADLAPKLGVGVTAVYAFEPLAEWVPENDPRSWRRGAEEDLETWTKPIAAAGADITFDVDRDIHPVAAIERALEAQAGTVAVVGTRGVGGFPGLRLGRVPLQLVHRVGAAVVLVPPTTE